MSRAYYDYLRICRSGECLVRKWINVENDKKRIRHMINEYCTTCVSRKFMVNELRRGGKL